MKRESKQQPEIIYEDAADRSMEAPDKLVAVVRTAELGPANVAMECRSKEAGSVEGDQGATFSPREYVAVLTSNQIQEDSTRNIGVLADDSISRRELLEGLD